MGFDAPRPAIPAKCLGPEMTLTPPPIVPADRNRSAHPEALPPGDKTSIHRQDPLKALWPCMLAPSPVRNLTHNSANSGIPARFCQL
jgi:hypothetical protein